MMLADISKADLPRSAHASPVVTTQIHIEPAYGERHGGVRAHGDQKERSILQVRSIVHGSEDGEAGDADTDAEDCEAEAMSRGVGKRGTDEDYGQRISQYRFSSAQV